LFGESVTVQTNENPGSILLGTEEWPQADDSEYGSKVVVLCRWLRLPCTDGAEITIEETIEFEILKALPALTTAEISSLQ